MLCLLYYLNTKQPFSLPRNESMKGDNSMKAPFRATFILVTAAFSLLVSAAAIVYAQSAVTEPESYFGYSPGDDNRLFTYDELTGYLKTLESESPMIKLVDIGTSTLGRTMYIAFISSKDNIARLDELKAINTRLALDPDIPENERESLVRQGRVFFTATLSMHSTEVGPAQAAPTIAYKLITSTDPHVKAWLDNVVYMMVPNHNPDGMDMVVAHYRKYRNTKYDGCSMPGLYHKYVGHDDNRDFITLSQKESRAISKIFATEWFPQVMVEKHQMGSTGARYFVPPNHDPIAENIDAGMWNWIEIFGANMIKDMTRLGQAGIAYSYIFDNYWPGSTETCMWKNVISFLTECASVKLATPIFVEPNELGVGGKGLSEYKKSVNFPMPWKGGWWRLSDIVAYEVSSTFSAIKTSSLHKDDILRFRNDLCVREVNRGKTEPPFYFVFPVKQHDAGEMAVLVNLLMEHGVQVFSASESMHIGNRYIAKDDIVVPLAQPFRAFIKEVLETQEYPVRHYTPDGKIIYPYDITSWSLPLHYGVDAFEVKSYSKKLYSSLEPLSGTFRQNKIQKDHKGCAVFSANNNESFKAAFTAMEKGLKVQRLVTDVHGCTRGSFIIPRKETEKTAFAGLVESLAVKPAFVSGITDDDVRDITVPSIALVETYYHDMDAGWTRYILDTYNIPYKVLRPSDFETKDLSRDFDVILFPNNRKSTLMTGKYSWNGKEYMSTYPPAYVKGMGKKGLENLLRFIDEGGIVGAWGRSTELFMGLLSIGEKDEKEEFQLPVGNIADQMKKKGLNCPGSLVQVELKPGNPLTLGMPGTVGVFYRGNPVFSTQVPVFDMDRRVIARCPEKDILVSGFCENEELLEGKPLMVWVKKNRGQAVLFGFSPQFRASTHATYKLLFNTLLLPKIK